MEALPDLIEEYLRDLPALVEGYAAPVRGYEVLGEPGKAVRLTAGSIRRRSPEEVAALRDAQERERAGRFRGLYDLLGLKVVAHKDGTLILTGSFGNREFGPGEAVGTGRAAPADDASWDPTRCTGARAPTNAISSVVQSLALSRPGVGFYLRSDGRRVLALPAAADLRERIAQVHGLTLARSLISLEDPLVWGFVSPLSVSFPTRRYLHVAVNGRVVDTDSFAPAVAKAYADLLPKGRHPAAFLRLELGPGEVDVNVHPAKSAVRLRGGRSA